MGRGPTVLPLPKNPTPHRHFGPHHRCAQGFFYTPYFFMYTPDQFELVTPVGVKSWTDAEAATGIY